MCGQFAILGSIKAIKDYYNFLKEGSFILDENDFYKFESSKLISLPNEKVKPMDYVPIVVGLKDNNIKHTIISIIPARWGLVPFWSKDDKIAYKTINARIETIHEKPSFKYAYAKRRCLIPFTGFFERVSLKDTEKPFGTLHYFQNENDNFLSFAGLYEIWGAERLITFTIITCPANDEVSKVHHRMPLILDKTEAMVYMG